MSLWESIGLAMTSLRSNKMRSLLTLLGVIIGIASVITILTLGQSLRAQTLSSLDQAGANDFTIQVQPRPAAGEPEQEETGMYFGPTIQDADDRINAEMVEQLKVTFQDRIKGVSIGDTSSHAGDASVEGRTSRTTLKGINTDYQTIKNVKLSQGRLLREEDITGDRPVAIISPTMVKDLFQDDAQAALGQMFDFETDKGFASFVVVGVYEEPKSGGVVSLGSNTSSLYVPYLAEERVSDFNGTWDSLSVRVNATAGAETIKQDLQTFVDRWYADNTAYQAKVTDMKKELEQFNTMLSTMSIALSAIAGISLLVGGIGVMNIMLITVTERTREIGVRKALGATRRHIRTQFVVESMIVCLIGGLIGIILGGTFGMVGAKLLGTFVYPPISGVFISLFFSLAIGLFFGYYPANKAAKLDPIEALRYE